MTDAHPIDEPSILGSVLRHPLGVGIAVVGGLLLGGLAAVTSSEHYEAVTQITVEDPRQTVLFGNAPAIDAKRFVADQADLMQSPEVLRQAASRLSGSRWGEVTMQDVRAGLAVRRSDASNTLAVAFGAQDEAFAAAADEAVVVAYIDAAETIARGQYDNTINELDSQLAELDSKIATLDKEIAAYQDAGATMVDARLDAAVAVRARLYDERGSLSVRRREVAVDLARNPSGVTRRSTVSVESAAGSALRFVLLGGFLGALAGTAGAYVKARRRRRFEAASEPQQVLGLRYLATVPALGRGTPSPALLRQRESVLEFLATVVEGEARRRRISRFGFVAPSASRELTALGASLQTMLGGMPADAAGQHEGVDPVVIDLRDGADGTATPAAQRPSHHRHANGTGDGPLVAVGSGDGHRLTARVGAGGGPADAGVHAGGRGDDPWQTMLADHQAFGAADADADAGDGDGGAGAIEGVLEGDHLLDVDDDPDDVEQADGTLGHDQTGHDENGHEQHGHHDQNGHDHNGHGGWYRNGHGDDGSTNAPHSGADELDAGATGAAPGDGASGHRAGTLGVPAGGGPSDAGQPANDTGETLVLVECPQYAGSDAGDQLDAIVVVIDHGESIAAAAEVARRVEVLGWDLLGYVYVADRVSE